MICCGYAPTTTCNVIVPTGCTFIPPKPTSGEFTGRRRSHPNLICWKAGRYKISTELPLSTSTLLVVKSAMSKVMTIASSWGWWILSASSSVNVIACSSVFLSLVGRSKSWTLCTTFRYVFLDLNYWPVELPPTITLISPRGGCDDSSAFPLSFSSLWPRPRKLLSLPCLIRFSIYCFRSKHSSISCPWSLWKR